MAEKKTTKKLVHDLVPKHELMKEDEVEKILKVYGIAKQQLPRILSKDPALEGLDANRGDVVRIERKSPTAILTNYYRIVI
ncbi:MAG: DNA-directed RNA polymerase subunit H [Candidatus Undinarchaeales archaeon]|jgi:DNA-directed RNA polymerase subunit H|nr:DNA-directed RNA polymerase subunit H [Candidatus Undinarchaeales archaeon]